MGQREVSESEIRAAEAEGHASLEAKDPERGWAYKRTLKDGRVLYLFYMGRGTSVGISANDADWTFDEKYDYFHDGRAGWEAALGWDGEGEPSGWSRAKGPYSAAYRRRPDGDPTKEFEAP